MDINVLRWLSGIIIGCGWSVLSYMTTVKLLNIALLKQDKKKIFALVLIKFPLLYLALFLLLISKWVAPFGVLIGIGLALIFGGISRLWPKRT